MCNLHQIEYLLEIDRSVKSQLLECPDLKIYMMLTVV